MNQTIPSTAPLSNSARHHAIVIGGSMAGLLAARALADFYEHVTILERDGFPEAGEHRKGVPQSRHAHALLPSGREVLEAFFPGLSQELVRQGAILADSTQQSLRCISGSYHCRFKSGKLGLYVGRARLEAQVRTRVLALRGVQVIENCNVLSLVSNEEQNRVTGVRLLCRSGKGCEEILEADLVVDASGRGSRSVAWLESMGYAAPEKEQVKVDVSYATRLYRRTPGQAQGAYSLMVTPVPPNPRMGVMLAMENDCWQVTLVGYLGEVPPTDGDGFVEFAKNLPAPDVYEAIRNAEPIGEIVPAKFPASTRHHFEKLARFPAGFLVFGDAICSFNPTYGQGMTVAAMEALLLQQSLAAGEERLAARFFAAASQLLEIPWTIAVGGDLRFPEVEGKRSPIQKWIDGYMVKLHRAAAHDPEVVKAFGQVATLQASPKSLLHPRVVWRVLVGNLFPHTTVANAKLQPATAQ